MVLSKKKIELTADVPGQDFEESESFRQHCFGFEADGSIDMDDVSFGEHDR